MARCLRCGAGNEWIEGRVPREQIDTQTFTIGSLRFEIHENIHMPKDEVVIWQGERRYLFKFAAESSLHSEGDSK